MLCNLRKGISEFAANAHLIVCDYSRNNTGYHEKNAVTKEGLVSTPESTSIVRVVV